MDMTDDTVGFIGGGNMATAIAAGLVAAGVSARRIAIAEPAEARRAVLESELPDARIMAGNDDVATAADCLVLAVKPQILPDVCRKLAPAVQSSRPLVVSIAAGVRSGDIDSWLGGDLAVVRVMPNQPALLGKGISGLYANPRCSAGDVAKARSVLEAVGEVVVVEEERHIDAVTAVSGSGPAYFFLLIDMLATAGVEFGLQADDAARLAVVTAAGSAELAMQTDHDMAALIARVRSPGGTTAAALDSLDADDVRAIFRRALAAARDRAVVLADEAHRDQAKPTRNRQ